MYTLTTSDLVGNYTAVVILFLNELNGIIASTLPILFLIIEWTSISFYWRNFIRPHSVPLPIGDQKASSSISILASQL